jgi:hypothetical protein
MTKTFHLFPSKSIKFILTTALFVAAFGGLSGCALMNLNNGVDIDGMGDQAGFGSPTPQQEQQQDQNAAETEHQNRVIAAVSRQDILLGMDQQQVMAAWGTPRDVETAGNPGSGAERWIYYRVNSLTYGLGSPKIVYFENGRVVGWESASR